MSEDLVNEVQLANHLIELGCAVGRSKSGRLLRVDNRECSAVFGEDPHVALLDQVLQCSAIKELYLRNLTGFLNERASDLACLAKLKVLDVEGSDLNDESLQTISQCDSMQVLNIRGTNVTGERVATLRKIMIGVRIIS